MRYIIELNGEEPITTIEEILDRELGRNCVCKYADYDKEYLDELANNYEKSVKALCDFHKIEPSLTGAFKAGYKEAMEG